MFIEYLVIVGVHHYHWEEPLFQSLIVRLEQTGPVMYTTCMYNNVHMYCMDIIILMYMYAHYIHSTYYIHVHVHVHTIHVYQKSEFVHV